MKITKEMLTAGIAALAVVSGLCVIMTGYSLLYWSSRVLLNLEAAQTASVKSFGPWRRIFVELFLRERIELGKLGVVDQNETIKN